MNFLFVLGVVAIGFLPKPSLAQSNINGIESEKEACLSIHHRWVDEAFVLTKNCVGFSAPVSGRAYSYFAIGMYESVVEMMPELQSLTGQLTNYERTNWKENKEISWPLVANSVDFTLLCYYYRNMPPANQTEMMALEDSIRSKFSKKHSKSTVNASIEYGKSIANELISWSKLDGADNGFNENFPESFEPPKCISCWSKTVPGYLPSLLPYWGENKHLINGTEKVTEDCMVLEFSKDSNSMIYQDALSLYQNGNDPDPKYEIITEYWDDSPGYSGTPSGHYFTMAKQLALDKKLPLDQAMELYVKLGLAINEAFISCWKLKFEFNFIRPVTYIQQYIDPQFNTRIASPPFPEFPSGHSFQSGAATEIMKSFFGDSTQVTDRTNATRSDIDGAPRTFQTLTDLAEEISISRFYGGIHFFKTLEISLDYGQRIGIFVANEVKCRK